MSVMGLFQTFVWWGFAIKNRVNSFSNTYPRTICLLFLDMLFEVEFRGRKCMSLERSGTWTSRRKRRGSDRRYDDVIIFDLRRRARLISEKCVTTDSCSYMLHVRRRITTIILVIIILVTRAKSYAR